MEALVEDVDALVAPDLSTDGPDWCDNCQALRKEIRRLQEEHGQNFGKLKQKIISTDLLIKKYKAKCEDYDALCKKIEEMNKKSDKQVRQSSILETQLKAALLDVDPLRQSKAALEVEVKDQAVRIKDLTDKVFALEGTQKQYEYLSKASSADAERLDAEKKELLSKIKTMEAGKISKEAAKEYKVEISAMKKENQSLVKDRQRLDKKLSTALLKIDTLTLALKDAKSSPVGRRRRTSSTTHSPMRSPLRRSPLKSPLLGRNPRGRGRSPKLSPATAGRKRTQSARETKVSDPGTSGNDSDSSDKGSVCSLSWTFSPLVKCLSPLPPSPACFPNTAQNVESEDSCLSDMADELEQQLAEDFNDNSNLLEQQTEMEKIPSGEEKNQEIGEEDDEENDTTLQDVEEQNGEDLFDLSKYESGIGECEKIEVGITKQETANLMDKTDLDSLDHLATNQDRLSEAHPCKQEMDVNSEDLKTKHEVESSDQQTKVCSADLVKDISSIEQNDNASVGENSVALHTGTPKKRIAHRQERPAHKLNTETNSAKNIGRKDSQNKPEGADSPVPSDENDSKTDENDDDNTQSSEKSKDFLRADTSEFVPVLQGSTEHLSDSEPDSEIVSVQAVPGCSGDASSDDVFRKPDKTKLEVEIEIEDQVEQVERQYLPSRGMLTRQRHLSSDRTSGNQNHVISKQEDKVQTISSNSKASCNSSPRKKKGKKGKPKYGKHNFIAFQKSSSGTLAEEIDNLASDVDYVCNDRSEIVSRTANETLDSKQIDVSNLKLTKRRTYKDLDNITEDDCLQFCKGVDNEKVKVEQTNSERDSLVKPQEHGTKSKIAQEEFEGQEENERETTTAKSDLRRVKLSEGNDIEKRTISSNDKSHNVSTDTPDSKRVDFTVSDSAFEGKWEVVKKDNDEDANTQEEHKCDKDVSETEKVQTARQLSTGFVVNSTYSERSSESPSPSTCYDKEKYEKKRSKLKGLNSSLCETVLERIQEEDTPEDCVEDDSRANDDTGAYDAFSTDEINEPGCSYHYNDNIEDDIDDVLSSSVSLSEEIERITEEPGPSGTRVVTCTPDLLDSEIAQFIDNDSSRASSTGDSVERRSPVSPLPISPFEFVIPISPLPPSPYRDTVSPLSPIIEQDQEYTEPLCQTSSTVKQETENKNDETRVKTEVNNRDINEPHPHLPEEMVGLETEDLISVDDLELSTIPSVLSPIKTPERRKNCDKLKKSKTSAFIKVIHKNKDKQANKNVTEMQCVQASFDNDAVLNENNGEAKDLVSHNSKTKQLSQKPAFRETNKVKKRTEKNVCAKLKSFIAAKKQTQQELCGNLKKKSDTGDSKSEIKKEKNKDINKTAVKTSKHQTEKHVKREKVDNKTATVTEQPKPKTLKHVDPTPNVVEPPKAVIGDKTSAVVDAPEAVTVEHEKENSQKQELLDLPPGHDNLVTVKKKMRLAHRPNIQALRPQKVQMIEAQALPVPTVGRKRKSLETGDKDGYEKKQYKPAPFQRPKESNISKEETKSMQIFLKSQDTPENFVTKATESESGEVVAPRIVDCCIECLSRNRTDSTEVVYKVCVADDYRSLQLQWPFLSDIEKQATKLLKYLYSHEYLKVSYRSVMCRLWDSILGTSLNVGVVGQMCFCRVYTALCCLQGDVEQVRVLVHHLVASGHPNCCMFLVPVVSVWPQVLLKNDDDRPDMVYTHGMLLAIEEVMTRTLLAKDQHLNRMILYILKKLCRWRGNCGDTDTILKTLLTKLFDAATMTPVNNDAIFEVQKAVHLLSVVGGWPWFKEFFIMRNGLQTAANKYMAKTINKPVTPAYMCAILKITGSVTSTLSATVPVKDIEQFTRIWIFPVLARAEEDPHILRSCAEVLLELSPLLPTLLKGVKSRLDNQLTTVKGEFEDRVLSLWKQYQEKKLL